MMYNQIVQNCFFSPRHIGVLDCSLPRTVYFRAEEFTQKTSTALYMQCDEDHNVRAICYKTNGNPYIIASLEWLCRQAMGRKCEELYFNSEELIKTLEIPANQTPLVLYIKDVYSEVLNLMNSSLHAYL